MSGLKKKEQKMKTLGNKNKHAEFKETQILNMNWVIINKGGAEADEVADIARLLRTCRASKE